MDFNFTSTALDRGWLELSGDQETKQVRQFMDIDVPSTNSTGLRLAGIVRKSGRKTKQVSQFMDFNILRVVKIWRQNMSISYIREVGSQGQQLCMATV